VSRATKPKVPVADEAPRHPNTVPTPSLSDSVPVGPLRLSGIVKTTNGFAVASVELTLEEWEMVLLKRLGPSQRFKEHIALEHKRVISVLGQKA
jgi:hypothetical protein